LLLVAVLISDCKPQSLVDEKSQFEALIGS